MELHAIAPAALSTGTELVVFGVLVAAAALIVAATFTEVPYPILFVLGGATFGFVPGVPNFELNPVLVLVIVLPLLPYSASFVSRVRGLRATLAPIARVSP